MKPITLIALAWCITFSVGGEWGYSQKQIQEEQKPDYAVAEITFKSHDDVKLFGRLVLPKSNSPRAVLIYVQTAEGATIDMKRSLGGAKTFNYYDLYREKLTAMDIGFFSYEGRGIRMGDDPPRYEKIDEKVFNTSTLDNKVQDLLSAIETVREQDGLQDTPILLMGASEGTLLVAEAAAKKPDAVAGLDHSLKIGQYFMNGKMPKGHRAIFEFIDRIAPTK